MLYRISILFFLCLCGCSAGVRQVDDKPAALTDLTDQGLIPVIEDAAANRTAPQPDVIYLAPVRVHPSCEDFELAKKTAAFIHSRLYDRLLLAPREASILTTNAYDVKTFQETGRRIHRIETTLTECRRGNGLLRYVVGFGLGKVEFRIEGKVVDQATRLPLLLFQSHETNAGEPHMGWNPKVLSPEYCLLEAADDFARRLVVKLVDYI